MLMHFVNNVEYFLYEPLLGFMLHFKNNNDKYGLGMKENYRS